MTGKKAGLLVLLEVLREETDEKHVLTCREILDLVKKRSGISLNRRTFYSSLVLLEEHGFEVSKPSDNGKGYYLLRREFEMSEVLMLCNAIHASNFISSASSNDLIRKLLASQSRYERQSFSDAVYLPNRKKTENQELLLNIEVLSESIQKRLPVSFTYLTYNRKGRLVARRKEPYITEPRYIVYNDGRGYMICTSPNHPGFSHYRLDRMKKVVLMDEKTAPLGTDMDPYSYTKSKLFMFAGDNITAELKCSEKILSQMLDIFGPGTEILDDEEGFFRMHVEAPEQGILWLVQEYLDSITILSPQSLKEKHRQILLNALKRME